MDYRLQLLDLEAVAALDVEAARVEVDEARPVVPELVHFLLGGVPSAVSLDPVKGRRLGMV